MSPSQPYLDTHLEAGLSSTMDEEKRAFIEDPNQDRTFQGTPNQYQETSTNRSIMGAYRRAILLVGVVFIVALGLATAMPCGQASHGTHPSSNGKVHMLKRRDVSPPPQGDGSSTIPNAGSGQNDPNQGGEVTDSPTTPTPTPNDPITTTTTTSTTSTSSSSSSSSTSESSTTTPTPTPTPTITTTSTTESSTSSTSSSSSSTEMPDTTSSTSQLTITNGHVSSSSAIPHTTTSTLPGGGATTIVVTSWAVVVPTSNGSKDPQLHNAAPRPSTGITFAAVVGFLAGAVMMV